MNAEKEKILTDNFLYSAGGHSAWNVFDFSSCTENTGNEAKESVLIFVLQGVLYVSSDNLGSRIVDSGEMFLIPPRSQFYIRTKEKPSRIMTCRFQSESLLFQSIAIEKLRSSSVNNEPEIATLTINSQLDKYLSLLANCIADGIDSFEFFELKKKELFFLLVAGYKPQQLAALLYPVMGEDPAFSGFIHENYMKIKDIGELASMMNYSTSGFIKKFRRCFNESPYKWILAQKAKFIHSDIKEGVIPLQELVFKYNFCSYQHLATFCKMQYGLPPSEIRARKKE